jgi:hypothetical protein
MRVYYQAAVKDLASLSQANRVMWAANDIHIWRALHSGAN